MVGALSGVRKRGGGRQVAAYFARVPGRGSHPHPALSLNGEGKSGVSSQGLGITRGWCSKAWGARRTGGLGTRGGGSGDVGDGCERARVPGCAQHGPRGTAAWRQGMNGWAPRAEDWIPAGDAGMTEGWRGARKRAIWDRAAFGRLRGCFAHDKAHDRKTGGSGTRPYERGGGDAAWGNEWKTGGSGAWCEAERRGVA